MKKIYIYIIAVIILFLLARHAVFGIKSVDLKYSAIDHRSNNTVSILNSISSFIILPIIESRIDFYLKNEGIITQLQKHKYDNKLLEIKDIKKGTGSGVLCGQEVVIEIKELKTEKSIKIGTDPIQAINIGILGMKKDGIRTINVPKKISERLTGKKNIDILYTVTLKEIITNYPKSIENLLMFEKIVGDKKAIMCGDNVNLKYNLRNINGEEIRQGILSFKIGEGKAPLALELGTIEMLPDSDRTIIAPSELLDKNFPKNQISIIDIKIDQST